MRIALVAIDFPDQPFVITLPKHSDPFGNPQVDPVGREEVAQFYADYYNYPSPVNHGQTINGYWMEQSRGKVGVALMDAFGPYRMPRSYWYYGCNEHRQNTFTPTGEEARGRMERDCDSIWRAEAGDIIKNYDAVLRIYAGYDETGVWQEFGEMKFQSKDDISPEWGNPNLEKERWIPTRYVEWTSWLAGSQQWGLSSMRQGENSGTITHEIGHFLFRTGDNNNNPYVEPYRRAGSGTWDMMDRGCFNGPEGPHSRWKVPAVAGASMPAGLMLRQKLNFGFISENLVIKLSRDDLAHSGIVVAKVTARAVDPLPDTYAGIIVRLDGEVPQDRTPEEDPASNPLSAGLSTFNFYSMEVIQRIGYDSFTPDNGVLIAKNKDREGRNGGPNGFNCFNWVIDAHPEDIGVPDYLRPGTGEPVMRTVADYRQLNDALFHAGTNSGSHCEWVDPHNRLHFYVLDVERNEDDILCYTLGVRSLDGSGPHRYDVGLTIFREEAQQEGVLHCSFVLENRGSAAIGHGTFHDGLPSHCLDQDIYRLTATVEGSGWNVQLINELASVSFGEEKTITVYLQHGANPSETAIVTLTAVSESDPGKRAAAQVKLRKR
jgi:M6 family metalloprotease-like protein